MTRAMVVWLGFAGMLSAGQLSFQEATKKLSPEPGAVKVTADFPFTNKTDKIVIVNETEGDCPCTSVEISHGKTAYAPGESGVIRLNFDLGLAGGEVDFGASIWVDGKRGEVAPQRLTLKLDIPVLIEIDQKSVKWAVGQEKESKTIRFRMRGDSPIHVKSVSPSTERFDRELKTIEEGRVYDLVLTPKDLSDKGMTVFRVETDCEFPAHQAQQVFAVIADPDDK